MAIQETLCGLKPLPFWMEHPEKRKVLGSANINLKRLPNFGGAVDVPGKLGLDQEVVGMLALLWMGMVGEDVAKISWHTDVQDRPIEPSQKTPRSQFSDSVSQKRSVHFSKAHCEKFKSSILNY